MIGSDSETESESWEPQDWHIAGSVATYVVMSLPEGLVGRFAAADVEPGDVRAWLAEWLRERLIVTYQRAKYELIWPVAYLFVAVAPTPGGCLGAGARWQLRGPGVRV